MRTNCCRGSLPISISRPYCLAFYGFETSGWPLTQAASGHTTALLPRIVVFLVPACVTSIGLFIAAWMLVEALLSLFTCRSSSLRPPIHHWPRLLAACVDLSRTLPSVLRKWLPCNCPHNWDGWDMIEQLQRYLPGGRSCSTTREHELITMKSSYRLQIWIQALPLDIAIRQYVHDSMLVYLYF